MSQGVLINRPEQVYTPFDTDEVKRLREYVDAVDSFLKMEVVQRTWRWSIERVDPETSTHRESLDYVGEDALFDMAGRFRLLYANQHRMSFDAVRSLLNRHLAPESPLYAEARAELRTLREMKTHALKSNWKGMINGRPLTGETVIDLHLNGRYLHRDGEKADLLDEVSVIVRGEFLGFVKALAQVFDTGRAVVSPILATPSLIPASTGRQAA